MRNDYKLVLVYANKDKLTLVDLTLADAIETMNAEEQKPEFCTGYICNAFMRLRSSIHRPQLTRKTSSKRKYATAR